jgi:dihydroorotate dehydrogenase (NAD+) catalytic subunit
VRFTRRRRVGSTSVRSGPDPERTGVDLTARIGTVELSSPVMTASGTAGYGVELAGSFDLASVGALVTKSLAAFAWDGNPAPRLHPTAQGMLNAVGLQGPGIEHWLDHVVPDLVASGATVVASIWGRSIDDYRAAAEQLAAAPAQVVAVEVNLSCPNLEGRRSIFAHDPALSAAVIEVTAACGRPRWAKLSANTDRIVEVAEAVAGAGAEAVTCINTMLGFAYDPETRRPSLAAGGGGLSGRAIHPIAVRAVHDVHEALPELAIIGVGGVASGWDAAELLLAGASAVQVGTASFANPSATADVQRELAEWMHEQGIRGTDEIGALA